MLPNTQDGFWILAASYYCFYRSTVKKVNNHGPNNLKYSSWYHVMRLLDTYRVLTFIQEDWNAN